VNLGGVALDWALYRATRDDWEIPVLGAGVSTTSASITDGFSPSFSLPMTRRLEAVGSCELSREHVTRRSVGDSLVVRDAVVRTVTATPGLRLAFPGKGRLRLDAELGWRVADGPWAQLAPLLRRTDETGLSRLIKAGGEHRIQEKLTLSLSVSVGTVPGRGRIAEGSMEMAAYF
jgi:hypothetical protein